MRRETLAALVLGAAAAFDPATGRAPRHKGKTRASAAERGRRKLQKAGRKAARKGRK